MMTYLQAIYDARKSFYNKATVEHADDGSVTLYSYCTPVVSIVRGEISFLPKWNSSATTLRHVKEFAKQTGFYEQFLKAKAR